MVRFRHSRWNTNTEDFKAPFYRRRGGNSPLYEISQYSSLLFERNVSKDKSKQGKLSYIAYLLMKYYNRNVYLQNYSYRFRLINRLSTDRIIIDEAYKKTASSFYAKQSVRTMHCFSNVQQFNSRIFHFSISVRTFFKLKKKNQRKLRRFHKTIRSYNLYIRYSLYSFFIYMRMRARILKQDSIVILLRSSFLCTLQHSTRFSFILEYLRKFQYASMRSLATIYKRRKHLIIKCMCYMLRCYLKQKLDLYKISNLFIVKCKKKRRSIFSITKRQLFFILQANKLFSVCSYIFLNGLNSLGHYSNTLQNDFSFVSSLVSMRKHRKLFVRSTQFRFVRFKSRLKSFFLKNRQLSSFFPVYRRKQLINFLSLFFAQKQVRKYSLIDFRRLI